MSQDSQELPQTPAPRRGRTRKTQATSDDTGVVNAPPAPVPANEAVMTAPPPQIPPPPGSSQATPVQPAQNPYADAIRRDVAPRPTFWQGLGRTLLVVGGWLTALALGVLVTLALLVFGVPPFDRLPNPFLANRESVDALETQVSLLEEEIATLEAQNQLMVEEIEATAVARLDAADERLEGLESSSSEQGASLDDVSAQLEALSESLNALEEELPGDTEYNEYNRQLLLIRAWVEVANARDHLLQNNPGLATEQLARAAGTLEQALALSTEAQQAVLGPVQERLALATDNIDDNPFAAVSDLEVAWRALGEMIAPPGVVVSPAPIGTPESSATPIPEEDASGS